MLRQIDDCTTEFAGRAADYTDYAARTQERQWQRNRLREVIAWADIEQHL